MYFVLCLQRQTPILRDIGDATEDTEMPSTKSKVGGSTRLGHGGVEHVPPSHMAEGIDVALREFTTIVPSGGVVVRFREG